MTKEEFVHSIIKVMPIEYHENVVEKHISSAFNEVLSKKYWTFEQLDSLADTYSATLATENDLLYAPLPVSIITLPRVTDSVLSVRNSGSMSIDFVPVSEGAVQLFSYDNDSDEPIGFWLNKGKIFFENSDTINAGDTVLVRQVVPFTDYAWDDKVSLPGDMSITITNMVKQSLTGKQPDEHYNDYKE